MWILIYISALNLGGGIDIWPPQVRGTFDTNAQCEQEIIASAKADTGWRVDFVDGDGAKIKLLGSYATKGQSQTEVERLACVVFQQ